MHVENGHKTEVMEIVALTTDTSTAAMAVSSSKMGRNVRLKWRLYINNASSVEISKQ